MKENRNTARPISQITLTETLDFLFDSRKYQGDIKLSNDWFIKGTYRLQHRLIVI